MKGRRVGAAPHAALVAFEEGSGTGEGEGRDRGRARESAECRIEDRVQSAEYGVQIPDPAPDPVPLSHCLQVGTSVPAGPRPKHGVWLRLATDGVPDLVLKADLPRSRQRGQAPSRCAC